MMNVLVEILGKQFKVSKGDKIKVPYINKKVGEKLTFENNNFEKTLALKNLGFLGSPNLKKIEFKLDFFSGEKQCGFKPRTANLGFLPKFLL